MNDSSEEQQAICISAIVGNGEDAHRIARVGATSITLGVGFADGVERTSAREVARMLGYTRERNFFKVVRRLESERPDFGGILVRSGVERTRNQHKSTRNGFVVTEPWLTERQALLASIESDTDRAWQVKVTLVDIFLALREMLRGANGKAILEQLTRRCDSLEAANAECKERLLLLDPHSDGTIGPARAREHIREPMWQAARMAAYAKSSMATNAIRSEFKTFDNQLRAHLVFPIAPAAKWDRLPVQLLGKATGKIAEISKRADAALKAARLEPEWLGQMSIPGTNGVRSN